MSGRALAFSPLAELSAGEPPPSSHPPCLGPAVALIGWPRRGARSLHVDLSLSLSWSSARSRPPWGASSSRRSRDAAASGAVLVLLAPALSCRHTHGGVALGHRCSAAAACARDAVRLGQQRALPAKRSSPRPSKVPPRRSRWGTFRRPGRFLAKSLDKITPQAQVSLATRNNSQLRST